MGSGQGQPTWALHIPSKLLYYTSKKQNGGYFCLRLYLRHHMREPYDCVFAFLKSQKAERGDCSMKQQFERWHVLKLKMLLCMLRLNL